MKCASQLAFLVFCATAMAGTLSADQTEPAEMASEDVSQLFDGDDVLDNVTVAECGYPSLDIAAAPKASTLQTCYQLALFSILSAYLVAKKFIIAHVPLVLASSEKTH